ncbi:MAG: hypothetical protein AAGC76_05500 [Luteibacter sp.]|uniref:hypothetical protein n=1 Tax=Luteibacter TaxID=242605 RepID=UPI000565653A|nr:MULTISPECIES: hypothetical protein [unclassified Luteibacter]MDQ7995293.1 hypothetical protein [Luteibacter sp.]MDR6644142.1 hypothetical protein [Luteibacter sp. 1214]
MKTCASALLVAATLIAPAVGAAPAPTMCARGDQPVFSCPLAGSKKTVSLCAAAGAPHGGGQFYYAYGSDVSKPELRYPGAGDEAKFTRTHLMFGGNTGGFAYAFTNRGFKYVIYSISGSNNLEDQGLVVLKDGETKPIRQSRCEAGKVSVAPDRSLIEKTLKWESDPVLEDQGIPTP